ncbi:Dihydroorotate dehydrogenase-domain-containing protein [Dipodascopsis tothii]|uniref:Dihydroorotate dehydrogenase-domain-containing protein n=1 Tax=Dipodascopsis tothii TaxID=44089 RepID=UPI0034CD91DE
MSPRVQFAAARAQFRRTLFTSAKPSGSATARNWAINTALVAGVGFGAYYLTDTRSAAYRYVAMPLIRATLDAETSHRFAIAVLSAGLYPWDRSETADPALEVHVFGKTLSSPVGLAAGFDKNGEAIDAVFNMGFSYAEVGSITPLPQAGNPLPRFFRLPKDSAAINRYGFNSDGHMRVLLRLRQRLHSHLTHYPLPTAHSFRDGKLLAINLGKNKTGDEINDYVAGVNVLGNYADVLVINISSPNTPGLRNLQNEEKLGALLKAVVDARDKLSTPLKPPVCVKIAPDLTEGEIAPMAKIIKDSGIDGVIVSNTTISRPDSLRSPTALVNEVGGLSGPPVKPLALAAVRNMRKHIGPDFTIIGCGGISTGRDAVEFARAGASFVQVYTAFAYEGPGTAARLRDEIKQELGGKRWMDIINSE